MALYSLGTWDVQRFSQTVNVPNNSIAKCMYYLDVVCTLLEYDESNLDRLRDFRNYHRLTDDEIRLLFIGCVALSPDLLIDKCMFEDAEACGNSLNRIYELSHVQRNFLVANSIFVAGRNRRVKKIMAYKPEWIKTFYYNPISQLTQQFQQQRRYEQALEYLANDCTIS
ncbi:unnamed protein product [Didymodactylos carnosus]|uniref:Uncharacterized protein n=1 Tax=Didymodactylos carnosus TaxID=1234261 RepID=A0A815YF99_9BILA|nr:unnamed protein product [Didymodactylos carnosus]CAF1570057.1 unnamed protein product [Didymodactylos carnosus]CAF4343485.1 unnamed protein product [Didymodactylos carnosus]CAF4433149.1 unnamed protein product [Didymodactylos carnosus]